MGVGFYEWEQAFEMGWATDNGRRENVIKILCKRAEHGMTD